jgi:hypothetical protein
MLVARVIEQGIKLLDPPIIVLACCFMKEAIEIALNVPILVHMQSETASHDARCDVLLKQVWRTVIVASAAKMVRASRRRK